MFDLFKARAEAVSTAVHRVPGKPQALELVLRLLRDEGVSAEPGRGALWAACKFLDGLDRRALARDVPGLSFEVTREAAAAALVGVSQVDALVADTGSLVQDATDPAQRLVSTLPRVHVAIAAARGLLPDLASLLQAMPPHEHPYLAFVTGPSRTADIERVLTIGVHGPERLHAVIVDDL